MMNQLERSTFLQTAFLATVSISAAVGLWSGLADLTPITGVIVVPAVWFTFTALLLSSSRQAVQRGYDAGIAGSQIDPMTRLPSTAVAKRLLTVEFAAAERGRPLTVVCFSVDDYAQIAATFGPVETKRLLVGIGTMLRRHTRGMNMSCRYDDNGNFVSVLGGIPPKGALTFVSKVHKDFASLRVGDRQVSISTSVCSYDSTIRSADDLLQRAQAGLPDARRRGGLKLVGDVESSMGEREGYALVGR